ncbi:hypothetical protein, partial [Streptomyces sp. NPDC056154]|uniref:hypothetical protein n=1 Tax=Streptomyces sp. NPDC056154 TaxID=3345729 RepID=UPI0035DF9FD2
MAITANKNKTENSVPNIDIHDTSWERAPFHRRRIDRIYRFSADVFIRLGCIRGGHSLWIGVGYIWRRPSALLRIRIAVSLL